MDINPKEIWDEMARRRQKMGVAEKLPKEGTLTNIDAPTARLLLLRSVKDFPMGKRGQKIASDNIANLSDQDVFKALDKMKNIGTLIHEIFEESILLNQEEITELSTHNISSSEQSEDKPIPFIR